MKKKWVIMSLSFVLSSLPAYTVYAHEGHEHEEHQHKAPHGGMVVTVQNYHYELVKKQGYILIYLMDKQMKPVALKGITGQAIVQKGKDKKTVALQIDTKIQAFKGTIDLLATKEFVAVVSLKIGGKTYSGTFRSGQ